MSDDQILAECDPGIREVVRRLREAGFETVDSGDGVSKPPEWYASGEAIPYPHVVAVVPSPDVFVSEAKRMKAVLGDGWRVEASWATDDEHPTLMASFGDPLEQFTRQPQTWAPTEDATGPLAAFADLERALWGTSGHTWEVGHAARVQAVLNRVFAAGEHHTRAKVTAVCDEMVAESRTLEKALLLTSAHVARHWAERLSEVLKS